jgi:hypothetical protein
MSMDRTAITTTAMRRQGTKDKTGWGGSVFVRVDCQDNIFNFVRLTVHDSGGE